MQGQGNGLNDKLQTNLTTNYIIQIIGKSDVHKTVWLFGITKAVIPEPIGLDQKDRVNKQLLNWLEIYYSLKIGMITAPVSFLICLKHLTP